MKTSVIITVALMTAGCVSSGTQVKDSALTQFQKGVTTESEVVKALGPPQSTVTESSGDRMDVYTGVHAQAKAASFIPVVGLFAGGANTQASYVAFTFDRSGVLKDYTSSQTTIGSVNGPAAGYQAPAPAPKVVQ